MNEMTVSEAFAANDKVREKFKAVIGNLSDAQLATRSGEGKWSVAEIVEHISIVESGIGKICSRLLRHAKENSIEADGQLRLSDTFLVKSRELASMKVEAPEMVRPSGTKTVAESLAAMDANRAKLEELRPLFEGFNSSDAKFPHPFLGEITAAEWLALIGGHAMRHLRQIERIVDPSIS